MWYILTRLAQALLTMVSALTILFLIVRLTPGDPAYIMLGDYATPELVAVIRERYGLDQPLPTQLRALTLPALALGFNSAALTARTTRSALLGVLGEDYLRTARAKGLAPWPLLWTHAIRTAMIPVLAVLGIQFGQLLGGAGV